MTDGTADPTGRIFGFATDDPHAATAALAVYVVWRSRDQGRFKITPDVWEKVERFVKASAKRATNLQRFLETLKPKLMCATLSPRWLTIGAAGESPSFVTKAGYRQPREPGDLKADPIGDLFRHADHAAVLDRLYRETSYVILLVRDRLERERAIERELAGWTEAEIVEVPLAVPAEVPPTDVQQTSVPF